MDIGVIRCTQSSAHRHTEQYSLLGKEVRLKVKAVFEKRSTLADPLSMRLCRSMWKQEHRWTGRSDCGRTHPGSAYWARTSRQSLCSVPDPGTDSILQGTPVTAPKLTVQRQMFWISIATEKLTTWKLLFSLALLHTSPMLKEGSHAHHLKALLDYVLLNQFISYVVIYNINHHKVIYYIVKLNYEKSRITRKVRNNSQRIVQFLKQYFFRHKCSIEGLTSPITAWKQSLPTSPWQ